MSTESASLFSIARAKLQSVVGGSAKDSSSLHRWVLLKNSIVRSHPTPDTTQATNQPVTDSVYRPDEIEGPEEEEEDAFMFPDPDALLNKRESSIGDCERAWLDSLLEGLGDDEDDADIASVANVPSHDDEESLSPLCSPMSSSDDLADHSSFYYSSEIAIPYPVPYPPLHPPLIPSWFELDATPEPVLTSALPLYNDPLPYYDADDLSVPDAIEDISDDESDAPSTPSSSTTTSLSPSDPAPRERTRLHSRPHVYVDTDSSYFYPFELDPLPFSNDDRTETFRSIYQEC